MTELIVYLTAKEREALRKAARAKGLHPRDLAQSYIRQGLLADASGQEKSNSSESQVVADQGAAVATVQ